MAAKVLVVDDEPDFRTIIQDVLGGAGFMVETAGDGEQGLALLKRSPPDLILLDWMMPKLSGREFCERLREDSALKGIPVILLTVKRETEDELEALHFGADDFVSKPFKAEDLLARVRAVLRRSVPG